ncbi:MAG: hypothetical protein KDC12_08830 [Flavobacteriales bacterium]|nr:hypothetical protein [Flavobacteriales bacterium]
MSFSQSLERAAVTSGGGLFEGGGMELSASVGQLSIATIGDDGLLLTQGFQQAQFACFGDFNGDGQIDTADLLLFLGQFGCATDCFGDLNGDGLVNTSDLLLFLGYFGTSCSDQ